MILVIIKLWIELITGVASDEVVLWVCLEDKSKVLDKEILGKTCNIFIIFK